MKKFFKGIWGLIKRHKLLTLIMFLASIVVIIMMYFFFSMFIGDNGKYGNRLDGIEKVKLTEKALTSIETSLEENAEVTDGSVRVQGKIVYIHIEVTRETSLDRAKELAVITLDKFEEDERKFYDFGFSLTQVEQEGNEDIGFVVTGTKNAKRDSISWIRS